MGYFTNAFNNELKKSHSDYERQMLQTYFTAPEWRNVEMAEELGEFLSKGRSFYEFPYFKQIYTFWNVFIQSYRAAKKHHSHRELILSEYMIMNLFIGVSSTLGFAALGTLSIFLSPFMRKENHTAFQMQVGDLVKDYSTFIHTIPFYNYNYLSKLKPLWLAYKNSPNKTLTDFITWSVASIELLARAILSAPAAWWYNQPQNQAADKIHLLVKSETPPDLLKNINKDITLINQSKEKKKDGKTIYYSNITIPRYEAFKKIVKQLSRNDVNIQKIAGQDNIQFKLFTDESKLKTIPTNTLYSYTNHLDKEKFIMIDVPTKEIKTTLCSLQKNNIKIKLMHDF